MESCERAEHWASNSKMQKQISQQIAFSLLPDVTQLERAEFVLVQWLGRNHNGTVFYDC